MPVTLAPTYRAILSDTMLKEGGSSRVDQLRVDQNRGSHRLRLVWLGRRRVPGIGAGVRLRVEGMVSLHEGLPTMYNPRYEIIGIQES
ncbi:single stranded DNA-binding domain-containing protein [Arthrobacter sp. Sr24]